MNVMKEALLEKVRQAEEQENQKIRKDPWRLQYHLMPPVGWLNDPNGLCQYKGLYHVFFQYSPFDAAGGLKLWGEYVSEDLIHWEYMGIPILPDSPYDCHGVYSGSAFVEDGKLELFYTGNVKYDGDYNYITDGREAYTMYMASEDGVHYGPKECLLSMEDYPKEYSCHIRDPKVWKEGQEYYMVLGGRRKEDKGGVLLWKSSNKKDWTMCNEITSSEPFGYMWECPDLFLMGENRFLSISPQGLDHEEYRFQNVYQSGYFSLEGNPAEKYELSEFQEWDMGFDFYAPQTFQDDRGRRILIAWAGLPDIQGDYENPTVNHGWQHALTLPREITERDGCLCQYPVKEIDSLRGESANIEDSEEVELKKPCFDWEIKNISQERCIITINKECRISYEEGIFILEFTGKIGAGRSIRKAQIERLAHLRILGDTSMLEIYVNHGEKVFTTRFYPEGEERMLYCQGGKGEIWTMNN